MEQKIGIYFLCFLAGIISGYFLFDLQAPKTQTDETSSIHDMQMSSEMHEHPMLEVDKSMPIPTVAVEAIKDEKDGYNIEITTTNYTFTPEEVNQDPVQGEGHAHIYVNGVKVARLYGNWFNIPSDKFMPGKNIIEVTLNANDHSEWVIDGQHISDVITIEQ